MFFVLYVIDRKNVLFFLAVRIASKNYPNNASVSRQVTFPERAIIKSCSISISISILIKIESH